MYRDWGPGDRPSRATRVDWYTRVDTGRKRSSVVLRLLLESFLCVYVWWSGLGVQCGDTTEVESYGDPVHSPVPPVDYTVSWPRDPLRLPVYSFPVYRIPT